MTEHVKPRGYHAPRRQEQARRTRRAILDAATRLFAERGYAATTMAAVADRAGVALDTVYAAVGPKPVLSRLLVDTAISGTDAPVPALERDYVRAIRAEPDAARKLTLYAQAIGRIQQRWPARSRSCSRPRPGRRVAACGGGIADRRAPTCACRRRAGRHRRPPHRAVGGGGPTCLVVNSPSSTCAGRQRGWDRTLPAWLADAWQRLLLGPH